MKTSGPQREGPGRGGSNAWPKGRCLNSRKVVLGRRLGWSHLHRRGRAVQRAELGRRPAAAGGIAGPSRVAPGGKRRGGAGAPRAGIGFGGGSAPSTPRGCRPDTPGSRSRTRSGPPSPQGALPPPLAFRGWRGPEVSARVTSGAERRVRRRTRQARGLQQRRPTAGQARSR